MVMWGRVGVVVGVLFISSWGKWLNVCYVSMLLRGTNTHAELLPLVNQQPSWSLHSQVVAVYPTEARCSKTKEPLNHLDREVIYRVATWSLLIQSKEQQPRSPSIQLKERSLLLQSNDQQPTRSLRQADIQVLLWVVDFFQRSLPPPPTYVSTE